MSREKAMPVDWEPYQEIIRTLYLERDMSLKEVMTYMKDTYSFHARYDLKPPIPLKESM
jgi:hypothetical protein